MPSSPFLFIFISFIAFPSPSSSENQRVYIVHLGLGGGIEEQNTSRSKRTRQQSEETHISYISSVKDTKEEAISSLLYSYHHSFHGFAASLSSAQAASLSDMEGVVGVWRSHPGKYSLHTTRSWEFSGLLSQKVDRDGGSDTAQQLLRKAGCGKDVVVGLLDSGVWPESESFKDEGMGDVPKSWRGTCQPGFNFNSSHCNRKIIGARYYLKGYEQFYGKLNTSLDMRSPRDMDGHGTHTASILGGRSVSHVSSVGGFAAGTATGGVPLSRLAIYKVCWPIPGRSKVDGNTCFEEDMLAAIDDAISDGVHVLSISIGTASPISFSEDAIAVGALHAVRNNIVVVCSAGNSGPAPASLSNPAPWIITVGASSLDRDFPAPIFLENGAMIPGETVTPLRKRHGYHPLVYAEQVVADHVSKTSIARKCTPGSLSRKKTKGKIVLCMTGNGTIIDKGIEAKRAGAVGFILGDSTNGNQLPLYAHVLPSTTIVAEDIVKLMNYINSTKSPGAIIVCANTTLGTKTAPSMAGFTSRGPNIIDPHILKPDVTAPGLNILAAWTGGDSPSRSEMDKRSVKYNIFSGTSMSCPHVAAAAAILRAIYPHWSSSAIRSAIITTATTRNNRGRPLEDANGNPADPFQYGAGHFRLSKMADPGLVYEASYNDYILHLCSLGVKKMVKLCPENVEEPWNLNHPSISVAGVEKTVTVVRTVKNVGEEKSVYVVTVVPPAEYSVRISPKVLLFGFLGEEKRFKVEVRRRKGGNNGGKGVYNFGWFCWSDGVHNVTSPMVFST